MSELTCRAYTAYMTEQAEQKQTLSVRVPKEWIAQLDGIASSVGKTRSDLLTEMVSSYLNQTPSGSVKSDLQRVLERMAELEKKLMRSPQLIYPK